MDESTTYLERRTRDALLSIMSIGDIILRVRRTYVSGVPSCTIVEDKVIDFDDRFVRLQSSSVRMEMIFAKSQIEYDSNTGLLYINPFGKVDLIKSHLLPVYVLHKGVRVNFPN